MPWPHAYIAAAADTGTVPAVEGLRRTGNCDGRYLGCWVEAWIQEVRGSAAHTAGGGSHGVAD